jgi:hypothetical protein
VDDPSCGRRRSGCCRRRRRLGSSMHEYTYASNLLNNWTATIGCMDRWSLRGYVWKYRTLDCCVSPGTRPRLEYKCDRLYAHTILVITGRPGACCADDGLQAFPCSTNWLHNPLRRCPSIDTEIWMRIKLDWIFVSRELLEHYHAINFPFHSDFNQPTVMDSERMLSTLQQVRASTAPTSLLTEFVLLRA